MSHTLDYLRRQAKTLKKAFARGETQAQERVWTVHPGLAALKHSQALHVIARENGYSSWPRLKLAFDLRSMDRNQKADRLKFALYLGQARVVEDLLDDDPTLRTANFGLICALYNVDGVREALARTPEIATALVGVRSPLLHLTFSKYHQIAPDRAGDAITVAELLVKAGANVNDAYPSTPESQHQLSALYGALGHAGHVALAEWLLENGASPDDNESLYHATELGHLDGVKLMMRHGAKTKGTNALARMLDFDDLEGAKLFLEYGADPNEAVLDHPSGEPIPTIPALHQAARRGRDGRFADLLLSYNADPNLIWYDHHAYVLARMYGNTSFSTAMERAGVTAQLDEIEQIFADCADGKAIEQDCLKGRALTDEQRRLLTRIILMPERFEHAQLLVHAGLDPSVPEEMDMPPFHLAGWAGLSEQFSWLMTLSPKLDHVNAYGGDIIGTIIHGSENRLDVEERDHVGCLRVALAAGVPVHRRELQSALHEDIIGVLTDHLEDNPEKLVE